MANKLISLDNLARYHQKFLEHYDARVLADEPSGGDDANYLENLFAEGRILLRRGAHYVIERTVILPAGTDVDMNGAIIEYDGPGWTGPDNPPGAQPPYTSGCGFLNVDCEDDSYKTILEYNGRGNIRFKNGEFINCAFGFMHGHDISFEDITFGEVKTNHVFQLSACKNVSFLRCTFFGIASTNDNGTTEVINLDLSSYGQFIAEWFFPQNAATLDVYACREITVDSCVFRPRNDSVYSDVLGYHANFMQPYDGEVPGYDHPYQVHRNIRAINNYIYGIKKSSGNTRYTVAFKIRHMMNCIFSNNVCENVQSLFEADHVRNVTVTGNVIQGNGNGANAFATTSTWHATTRGDNKQYLSTIKNLNVSGNMCDGNIVNNQTLVGLKVTKAFVANDYRIITGYDANNNPIYEATNWTENPDAKPRYSKAGVVTMLHGRVKPKTAMAFNAETKVLTLPESCRPATTVSWLQKGDLWDGSGTTFSLLVKITTGGVLSLTPITTKPNLTTAADLWIDGAYTAFNSNYSTVSFRDTPSGT